MISKVYFRGLAVGRWSTISKLASTLTSTPQRLYCPLQHVWISPMKDSDIWQLGLTEYHIDKLVLDIESIKIAEINRDSLIMGWSGLSISDGDETYHTIWNNVTGEKSICPPFPSLVLEINPQFKSGKLNKIILSEDSWLCTIKPLSLTSNKLSVLMNEKEYRNHVEGYARKSPCIDYN